jgi:hypothetical protein
VYRLSVHAGRLLVHRNYHPPIWDTLPFWYVTPRQGHLFPDVSTRDTRAIFRGRNTREEWRRLQEGKVKPVELFSKRRQQIVPRRRVASQTSKEPLQKPKTRILLYVRKEWAVFTVPLRGEQPEEELILFRFVLFTVGTLRQSVADMKYFNMKRRGNLVYLFCLFRNLTQQQHHCALWATPYRCFWKPDEWEDANR